MESTMEDLEFLFYDTDVYLSVEEENVLKSFGTKKYYFMEKTGDNSVNTPETTVLFQLVKKGIINIFNNSEGIYFYPKSEKQVAVEFNAYHAKVGRGKDGTVKVFSEEEKKKVSKGRAFFAKWIFNKNSINDTEHIRFLKIFTSRVTYTMAVPNFLLDVFSKEIDQTGIDFKIITPSFTIAHCSICRTDFDVREEFDSAICPECGADVIVR